jgi:hypothetical protein
MDQHDDVRVIIASVNKVEEKFVLVTKCVVPLVLLSLIISHLPLEESVILLYTHTR